VPYTFSFFMYVLYADRVIVVLFGYKLYMSSFFSEPNLLFIR
jgi:hypothetical protein